MDVFKKNGSLKNFIKIFCKIIFNNKLTTDEKFITEPYPLNGRKVFKKRHFFLKKEISNVYKSSSNTIKTF